MEQIANLHIEKLPEGVYLATCNETSDLSFLISSSAILAIFVFLQKPVNIIILSL